MAFHDFGAGRTMEVSGGTASRQSVMLPFTDEAVPEVDIEGGKVVVDPPAGLLAGGERRRRRTNVWRAVALTLFPEMFPGPLGESLAGKALKEGVWSLDAVDIRRFAKDRHGTVDDAPFGGGAGMVMKPDVLSAAIEAVARAPGCGVPKVLLSPRGAPFSQARGRELAQGPGVVLVCGRFEGVDERVIEAQALEEISVGDFVLSGGEIAAMAVMDCCVRLLPGVMGEPRVGERGEFRGRIAGVSALHQARELDRARRNRTARAGGSGLGPSRQGRGLAEAAAGRDYAAAAARSVGHGGRPRR